MATPDPSCDVEIRVASRLGSTVAAALGEATTCPEGPRMQLRIVSARPLALADLAGRLDALGLVVDGIRVTPGG